MVATHDVIHFTSPRCESWSSGVATLEAEMYAALLTAVVTWISANFALPPNYQHPQIKLVPAVEITFLRYQAFTPAQRREVLNLLPDETADSHGREAVAVYDDRTETIFLPDTWKGETSADLSVLVHEMVHHLQNSAHMKYECPGAREQLAYAAQDKWLNLFGRDLASEFDIDAFTLKVTTACGF
jgi:hypothetical protein